MSKGPETQQKKTQLTQVNVKKVDLTNPALLALAHDMEQEHIRMYGESDQDPSNSIETAEAIVLGYFGKAPVGLCAWGRYGSAGKIRQTYVDPEFRRTGVAQMMVNFIEDMMRTRGIRYNQFESGPEHKVGHKFWKALGYKEIEPFGFYKDEPGSKFYGKEL